MQKDKFEANLANGLVLEGTLDKAWNQARTVYGMGDWTERVSDVGDVEMHESLSDWGRFRESERALREEVS